MACKKGPLIVILIVLDRDEQFHFDITALYLLMLEHVTTRSD